jgi:hypothetical protein
MNLQRSGASGTSFVRCAFNRVGRHGKDAPPRSEYVIRRSRALRARGAFLANLFA